MGKIKYSYNGFKDASSFLNNGLGQNINGTELSNLNDISSTLDEVLNNFNSTLIKNYNKSIKDVDLYILNPMELGSDNIIIVIDKALSWDRHNRDTIVNVKDGLEKKLSEHNNIWVCKNKSEMYNIYNNIT